jgi:hypothetical protein
LQQAGGLVLHSDRAKQAYASLLIRHPWHWFASLTFRPAHESSKVGGVHPEKADKAFRVFISSINRELYGIRWSKKPHGGLVWARGQEFHKDGRIHFHALIASPTDDLNRIARRLDWIDWWYREFGIARIERPEYQDSVCSYVSKYVVKDGEVDFSRNFGRVSVPAISYQARPIQKVIFAPGEIGEESAPNQQTKTDRTVSCHAPREREPEGSNGTALGAPLPVA